MQDFLSHTEGAPLPPVNLNVRIEYNPNLTTAWFTSVMGIINSISMLAIILAGAAIIREREHGTMDHLVVMPLTPFEIAMSKVWANGLVILSLPVFPFTSSFARYLAFRSRGPFHCSCSAQRSISSLPVPLAYF